MEQKDFWKEDQKVKIENKESLFLEQTHNHLCFIGEIASPTVNVLSDIFRLYAKKGSKFE